MKTSEMDWSVLKGSAVVLAITLLVSGAMVWMSISFKADMRRAFEQDNQRFQVQSRRYLTVDEEEQTIKEYLPKYQLLGRRGIVGDERRLNWTETLRNVSQRLRLPSLRYNIEPREVYDPDFYNQGGAFQLYASTMRISLGMLHEGDLLRFLDGLRQQALGTFSVDSCALRRSGNEIRMEPDAVNFQADCKLLWITLNKPATESFR